jgi:hemerythrin-like metal-binding protein
MESVKFRELTCHQAQHREITGKITEFVARHKKGDASMYTQFLYFMRDWLNIHMQEEDQKYARWLCAQGPK